MEMINQLIYLFTYLLNFPTIKMGLVDQFTDSTTSEIDILVNLGQVCALTLHNARNK